MPRSFLARALDGYGERLNYTRWPEERLELLKEEMAVHEDAMGALTTCLINT